MKDNIDKLIEDLQSKDGIERVRARLELAKKGPAIIAPLKELLGSKKHQDRWEAVKTIGETGSPEAIPVLIENLTDDDFDIRWLAAEGLINIGEPVIKPLVSELLHDYHSLFLREGTHHVLKYLKAQNKYDDTAGLIPALESYIKADVVVAAENLLEKR